MADRQWDSSYEGKRTALIWTGSFSDSLEIIEIKYLPGAHPLKKIPQGDWVDLYTYEDVNLKAQIPQLISLGIAMRLPEGYEAIIAPRSSTFKKWGILQTNSIGIIDSTYCGNNDIWKMPVYPTRDIEIPKDTRLCQFRIQKNQPAFEFKPVEFLDSEDRKGFGSTGE